MQIVDIKAIKKSWNWKPGTLKTEDCHSKTLTGTLLATNFFLNTNATVLSFVVQDFQWQTLFLKD